MKKKELDVDQARPRTGPLRDEAGISKITQVVNPKNSEMAIENK